MTNLHEAGRAFRRFFDELRAAFLERENVFTQLELALLSREHLLIMGPPGTAKSALAQAVLGRIVDEGTGLPSLFSRQLTESTVQTDLLGPVNFKVLTETGRTEYLTDEGILGSTHALLDEVFDGRDLLLRSVLNALEERELKGGPRLSAGQLGSAVLTSNRYLSEAVARAPELLVAVADRLAFTAFVPRTLARTSSRAALLSRVTLRQRPQLHERLTLQQLRVLQGAVARVQVSEQVLEGVQVLTQELERVLTQEMTRLPGYVPTRSFSPRTLVKAVWALKAVVVRDGLLGSPGQPVREARPSDLASLRSFFTLGGPTGADLEELLRGVTDARERLQLETLLLEHRAFDEALSRAQERVDTGREVERNEVKAPEDFAAAEALGRNFQPGLAVSLSQALREKLVPGPRHAENRAALLAAARALCAAGHSRAARGLGAQGEGRTGPALWAALRELLQLARDVPELAPWLESYRVPLRSLADQALESMTLSARALAFEGGVRLEAVAGLARQIELELRELERTWSSLGAPVPLPEPTPDPMRLQAEKTRQEVVEVFQAQAERLFHAASPTSGSQGSGSQLALRGGDARRLRALEEVLVQLDPAAEGMASRLLTPLARAHVQEVLGSTPFSRVEQCLQMVQLLAETLRREGLPVGPLLGAGTATLEARLRAHIQRVSAARPSAAQAPVAVVNPAAGDAYFAYRDRFSGAAAAGSDGELGALRRLEEQLTREGTSLPLGPALYEAMARSELTLNAARLAYLRDWASALTQLGPLSLDALIRTRLPLLLLREGEAVRLRASVRTLAEEPGAPGEEAVRLQGEVDRLMEVFRGLSDAALPRTLAVG